MKKENYEAMPAKLYNKFLTKLVNIREQQRLSYIIKVQCINLSDVNNNIDVDVYSLNVDQLELVKTMQTILTESEKVQELYIKEKTLILLNK